MSEELRRWAVEMVVNASGIGAGAERVIREADVLAAFVARGLPQDAAQPAKPSGSRKWTPERIAELRQMRAEGFMPKQAAAKLGISVSAHAQAVFRYCERTKPVDPARSARMARARAAGAAKRAAQSNGHASAA